MGVQSFDVERRHLPVDEQEDDRCRNRYGERKEDGQTESRRPENSLARMKHKAGTANGTNERRIARQVELTPQLADMDIDQVRPRHKAIMPNVLQQHRAGHVWPEFRMRYSNSLNSAGSRSRGRSPREAERAIKSSLSGPT
jgi:hypothetical protein